jgi:hypothetical protein
MKRDDDVSPQHIRIPSEDGLVGQIASRTPTEAIPSSSYQIRAQHNANLKPHPAHPHGDRAPVQLRVTIIRPKIVSGWTKPIKHWGIPNLWFPPISFEANNSHLTFVSLNAKACPWSDY